MENVEADTSDLEYIYFAENTFPPRTISCTFYFGFIDIYVRSKDGRLGGVSYIPRAKADKLEAAKAGLLLLAQAHYAGQ